MSLKLIGKQARMGLRFLKEAVIEVLFKAQNEGPLQLEEITKRLCLHKFKEQHKNDALVLNIVFQLQSEGRIQHITENGGGWVITETEESQQRSMTSIITETLKSWDGEISKNRWFRKEI